MRALLQRVSQASVSVDGQIIGRIGPGLVVFIGAEIGDTETDARYLAEKSAGLRVFSDETSKFNLSALDTGGEMLVVSQFTFLRMLLFLRRAIEAHYRVVEEVIIMLP